MSWLEPLCDAVTNHWNLTGKAFNLAKVKPELLRNHVDVEAHLSGRKLKDAILEDATDELRLIRDPNNKLTWGVVPYDAELPNNLGDIFGSSKEATSNDSGSIRFNRTVWLAFSRPLKPAHKRFLELRSTGPFLHEVPDGQPLPPAGIEIAESYILKQDSDSTTPDQRDQVVVDSIKRWAQEKEISLRDLARRETVHSSASTANEANMLDISNLTQADKARIMIPLDLVEKIRFGA